MGRTTKRVRQTSFITVNAMDRRLCKAGYGCSLWRIFNSLILELPYLVVFAFGYESKGDTSIFIVGECRKMIVSRGADSGPQCSNAVHLPSVASLFVCCFQGNSVCISIAPLKAFGEME